MVGRLVSFWEGLFSGAILVSFWMFLSLVHHWAFFQTKSPTLTPPTRDLGRPGFDKIDQMAFGEDFFAKQCWDMIKATCSHNHL